VSLIVRAILFLSIAYEVVREARHLLVGAAHRDCEVISDKRRLFRYLSVSPEESRIMRVILDPVEQDEAVGVHVQARLL
jgi:hypothetical protein